MVILKLIFSYASVGGFAFGKVGVFLTNFAQYVTLCGVTVVMIILSGVLLNRLVSCVPAKFFSLCCGVYIVVVVNIFPRLKEVKFIAYVFSLLFILGYLRLLLLLLLLL